VYPEHLRVPVTLTTSTYRPARLADFNQEMAFARSSCKDVRNAGYCDVSLEQGCYFLFFCTDFLAEQ
jgi:hypothetical protein